MGIDAGNTIKANEPQAQNGVGKSGAKHKVSASQKDLEKGGNDQSPQRPSGQPFSAVNGSQEERTQATEESEANNPSSDKFSADNDSQEERTLVTQENEANNPSSAYSWWAALQELPAKAWKNLPEDPTGIWKQLEANWGDGGGDTAKKAAALAALAATLTGAYFVGQNTRGASLSGVYSYAASGVSPYIDDNLDKNIGSALGRITELLGRIISSPVGLTRSLLRELIVAVINSVRVVSAATGLGIDIVFGYVTAPLRVIPRLAQIVDAIKTYFIDERIEDIDQILEWIIEELRSGTIGLSAKDSVMRLSGSTGLMENPSESLLNDAAKNLTAIVLTAAAKSIDVKNALDSIELPDRVKEPLNQIRELFDTYNIPKTLVLNTLYYTVMLSNPAAGLAKAIAIEATAQLARKGPAQLSKEALATITRIKEQAEKIASNPGDAADHTLKTLDGFIKSLTGYVGSFQHKESA